MRPNIFYRAKFLLAVGLSAITLASCSFDINVSAESSESAPLVADTNAPSLSGSVTDGLAHNSAVNSPNLSWSTATDAGGSGVSYYELAIGTSSGGTQTLTWTNIGNVTSYQHSGLALTETVTYYPSIRAVDVAGNTSSVIQGDGWVVDLTQPSQPLSFDDMSFGSINESPLMNWLASADSGSGIGNYQLALGSTPGATDLQSWQSVGTALQGKLTSLVLTNGVIYYPSLRAIDNAGNTSIVSAGNGWRAVEKWKNQEPGVPIYLHGATKAVVLQSDNKRILGGEFTTFGGETLTRAGRLNTGGTVDTGFAIGTGFSNTVSALVVQSDGKILAGGSFTSYNGTTQNRITRLNADGTRDTGFTVGTGFNNTVSALAVQSDGKILVGGDFTDYNGTAQNRITRLNADGTRDTGFSIGTGFNSQVLTLAVQSDGKILIGGIFINYNGTAQNRITRLNIDGTLDGTFIIGTGFDEQVSTLAVQSDGKILVGGAFTNYDGTAQSRITRLDAAGTVDAGFTIGTGFNGGVKTLALQGDGKILVGGAFTNYDGTAQSRITRLNTDGTRNVGFTIGTGFGDQVQNFTLQSDGKILVGGVFTSYDGTPQNHITRLNMDGTRDVSFIIGTGFDDQISALTLQSDGKILVGGSFTGYGGTTQKRIIRENADGTQDAGFTIGTGFNNTVAALVLQSDGKILVGGDFTDYNGTVQNRITRLNIDGTLDGTFIIGTGFNSAVFALAVQSDGKILVGGDFTDYNGTAQNRITRLNSDGTLDGTFIIGTGFNNTVSALVVQSDGKILVGGSFTDYDGTAQNRITRLNTDGTFDAGFTIGAGFDDQILTLAVQSDGKILVGGTFTSYGATAQNGINRLNADGSQDTGFASGMAVSSAVFALAVQSDGKIVVGGNSPTRLNADGSIDTSFNDGTGFNNIVYAVALQSDGKILMGGAFDSCDGAAIGSAVLLGW